MNGCVWHRAPQFVDELVKLSSPLELPTDFRHIASIYALDKGASGKFQLQVKRSPRYSRVGR